MRAMTPSGSRIYAVPALEKGLDLLEALASVPRPLAQSELARRLGRSPSEIFRMLNCLERRGYLEKEAGTGRYQLTLRLFELAHAHTPVDALRRASAGPMRELARSLGESVHLSVASRGELVVVHQEDSPRRIRVSVEIGGRFPLVRTASGRVILAQWPADELERFLASDPEWAALGTAARKAFLADLLEVRRTGVFGGRSDLTEGIRDFAALVGNPAVGVAAALCIPSLAAAGKPRPAAELREAVRRAADRITRALGLKRVMER
jgi:DNA-binding IclR family transcriptional regulator